MISYLKFTFIFLFEVLKTNIVKTLLIIGAVLTFMYAGTFKPDVQEYNVATTVRVDSDYVYVCKTISENKIKYENVWSQSPIPVKDGKIYVSSYAFVNGLMWFLFAILAVILVVGTIIGRNDDDIGWELEDCWEEALSTLIYCEEEDGKYYYFALGRLIDKRDNQISRRTRPTSELNLRTFRDLYRCPKYKTKKERREQLLNKIGI